jgi:hypothetical protein
MTTYVRTRDIDGRRVAVELLDKRIVLDPPREQLTWAQAHWIDSVALPELWRERGKRRVAAKRLAAGSASRPWRWRSKQAQLEHDLVHGEVTSLRPMPERARRPKPWAELTHDEQMRVRYARMAVSHVCFMRWCEENDPADY